jgi:hypothetical protein
MRYFWPLSLVLLFSCSFGVKRYGGERPFVYDSLSEYSTQQLKDLAPELISVLYRDPPKARLQNLFSPEQQGVRRVGIMVFESIIQPSRGGLSKEDLIYLSAQGKQLLTEKLLSVWNESFSLLADGVDYVPVSRIKKSRALSAHGTKVVDHIKAKRSSLAPDDIFYIPPGKEITMATTLNPRGMRDLSLAMVPASELMLGPKFSEHMKHAVNELCRELNLDGVIVIKSEINWSAARIDKHSGEILPEEVKLQLSSSVLVPYSSYHKRLEFLGEKRDLPQVNVAYRTYEARAHIPVLISHPEADQNFKTIENELITPMLRAYRDFTQMMIFQMASDLQRNNS